MFAVLGMPLLILVMASITLTAYLGVSLIMQGIAEQQVGSLLLGSLLTFLWLLMLYKTARARLAA